MTEGRDGSTESESLGRTVPSIQGWTETFFIHFSYTPFCEIKMYETALFSRLRQLTSCTLAVITIYASTACHYRSPSLSNTYPFTFFHMQKSKVSLTVPSLVRERQPGVAGGVRRPNGSRPSWCWSRHGTWSRADCMTCSRLQAASTTDRSKLGCLDFANGKLTATQHV